MELQGGTAAWQQQGYQVIAYTTNTGTVAKTQTQTQSPAGAGDGME
jgi:hypothetical protein